MDRYTEIIGARNARLSAMIGAFLLLVPISAQATTCKQFGTRIIEGAVEYKLQLPGFSPANNFDDGTEFWNIEIMKSVRSMLGCTDGQVKVWAADANAKGSVAMTEFLVVFGIGLYAYGLDWKPALSLRDQLVSELKNSGRLEAKTSLSDGSQVSLMMSVAGIPTLEIKPPER